MGYLFDCSLTGLDNNHSKQDVFFGSALIWQAHFYLHVIFVVDAQITAFQTEWLFLEVHLIGFYLHIVIFVAEHLNTGLVKYLKGPKL